MNKQLNNGRTALMFAAWGGHDKCVDLLIYAGADVNVQDVDGWTAVMLAAQRGSDKCVDFLIN